MITKKELKQDYKKITCVDSARFGVTKKTRELIEADNLDNMALFIQNINRWSKKYSNKTIRGEVIDELNRIYERDWTYYKVITSIYVLAGLIGL